MKRIRYEAGEVSRKSRDSRRNSLIVWIGHIGWSVGLRALRIGGRTRNAHWESAETRDTGVLIICSEQRDRGVPRAVYSIWIIDPDRGAVDNFDGAIKCNTFDCSLRDLT